jgi:hypothetical protein
MSQHKYILEPYRGPKTRHTCPQCQEKKRFTRYIDSITGIYISDNVGRCDRENNCNYHYTPSSFFSDNPSCKAVTYRDTNTTVTQKAPVTDVTPVTPIQYLPHHVFNWSMDRFRECSLYPFLSKLFRPTIADQLCKDFFIGSNKDGYTVFWQMDKEGNIRQAKVMQYDPESGRRNKEKGAFFAGKKILKDENAHLRQCFFGEYQLADEATSLKPVAIVESEKTAVIASVYYPNLIWIATGGKYGCRWTESSACKVLAKRKVILYPDLGAFDAWRIKGQLVSAIAGCKVAVSSILERMATNEDREQGLDLADFLLRKVDSTGLAVTAEGYPVFWDK